MDHNCCHCNICGAANHDGVMLPALQRRKSRRISFGIAILLLIQIVASLEDPRTSSIPHFFPFGLIEDNGFTNIAAASSISKAPPDLPSACRSRYEYGRDPPDRKNHAIQQPSKISTERSPTKFPRNRLRRLGSDLRRVLASSPWVLQFFQVGARLIPSIGLIFARLSKLLLPLYFARRSYQWVSMICRDWYTGRYLRTTFERMHTQYRTRYRIPECSRSVGRLAVHLSILFGLGRFMEWLIGISHAPCTTKGYDGCQLWCACLWMVAVMGLGHAAGVAIAVWGGHLKIQVEDHPQRPSGRRIFTRPWVFLRWMVDPDKWFREIIAHDRHSLKPFNPEAMMFPATWSALRIMFLVAIAVKMGGDYMHTFMRRAVVYQALSDEWYRVLMCERRVAWAILIVGLLSLSTLRLSYDVFLQSTLNILPVLLTAPSVLAIIISSWMNVLVYFDRRQKVAVRRD